jgi:hypothetical protein
MGAIAAGGVRVLNDDVVDGLRVSDTVIDRVTAREQAELERRARVYRGDRPAPVLRDQTVVLVDDGLATGTTMRAAITAPCAQRLAQLVVAIRSRPPRARRRCGHWQDALVYAVRAGAIRRHRLWYEDFAPTTTREVCALERWHATRMSQVPRETASSAPVSQFAERHLRLASDVSPSRRGLLGMTPQEVEQRLELWALNRVGQANGVAAILVLDGDSVLSIIGRTAAQCPRVLRQFEEARRIEQPL